jgi:hypothetical protein
MQKQCSHRKLDGEKDYQKGPGFQGWIVTLAILRKQQRSTKPKRLPVRIIGIAKQSYILISQFRRLKGGFQPGQLNTV